MLLYEAVGLRVWRMSLPDEAQLTPGELLVGVDEAPPAALNVGTPGGPDLTGVRGRSRRGDRRTVAIEEGCGQS